MRRWGRVATVILTHPTLVAVGLLLVATTPTLAQSEARAVFSATPRYLQRGTVTSVRLNCAWLPSAEDILFYSPGLACRSLTLLEDTDTLPSDGREYLARIEVAFDCWIGQH